MKNFLQYLSETQKIYEFKVKLANVDPKDHMDRIKSALAAYVVDSISTPKHLPIMENNIDFPSMKNADVHVVDIGLKYPLNDAQLRALMANTISVPLNQVFVVPAGHPEELWRNGEGELKEYVEGDAELVKPLPESTAEQQLAGQQYSVAGSILKELNKPAKFEIAGTDTTIGGQANPAHGKTTNDIAPGTAAPVGSKKVAIPNPNTSL